MENDGDDFLLSNRDVDTNRTGSILDSTICYGSLCNGLAQFVNKRTKKSLRLSRLYSRYGIRFEDKITYLVSTHDEEGKFAVLDRFSTSTLYSVRDIAGVEFEAIVSRITDKSTRDGSRDSDNSRIMPISINLLGPLRLANQVGQCLDKLSVFLQHPYSLRRGVRYKNPQYYHRGTEPLDLTHLVEATEEDIRQNETAKVADNIFTDLEGFTSHQNGILSGAYLDYLSTGLKRELKPHQLSALNFITQRENESFCHQSLRDLLIITNTCISGISLPRRGGIIADVMGLGKTLTGLSTIFGSKKEAVMFEKNSDESMDEEEKHIPSRATLVIVTSSQVLEVWLDEISRHFKAGALNCLIFHGQGRATATKDLVGHDIVLTTYGTLVADQKKRGLLQNMVWFRVILDEAHWIRNQSSQQFRAVQSLTAERRWCLTGTPVQNSLQDILSLIKFLHFEPFAESSIFERCIVAPIRNDEVHPFENLRSLLKAICLRRNEQYLQLDPIIEKEVKLQLSETERQAYKQAVSDCQSRLDHNISSDQKSKDYNVIFATIMVLRQICNLGISPGLETSKIYKKSYNLRKRRRLTVVPTWRCELCTDMDTDMSTLLGDSTVCPDCGRNLDLMEADASLSYGLSPPDYGASSESTTPEPLISSPSTYHSTKLDAVVKDIQQHAVESKSVVFTFWRATLDKLQAILNDRNIKGLRIDGRIDAFHRSDILSSFRHDNSVRVLLMSIETGSVGLNLTIANRVYIIEPQWNPAVEHQAIARAWRMGQTKPVTVLRYLMENTVEERIFELKTKKQRLAKLSLEEGGDQDPYRGLFDLKLMLDLDQD